MSRFRQFCTSCKACGGTTSRAYARQHDGKCKECVTGTSGRREYKCPDCGGPLSAYQHAHHYHCDACTRACDPQGYYNEVMGYND